MARKKEGYDWVTNTYYIPVESGGCGCFVVLGIIIWVLIKFDDWYEDHAGLFWGLIIALVALIIVIISMRSSSKAKQEEEAAQEAKKERDAALKARRKQWCTEGFEALRNYSTAYSVQPLLRRNCIADGLIVDTVAPKGALQLLVYLDFPFREPNIVNGTLSLTINSEQVLSMASGGDLPRPMLFKVDGGDHIELRAVAQSGKPFVHLGDLQLAWCFEATTQNARFTFIPYDIDDEDTMIDLKSTIYVSKRFVVDFSTIEKTRRLCGWTGPSRKSRLFSTSVPEGCSRLYILPCPDGGHYNLLDSGITLAIVNNDQILDILSDDGANRNERVYPVVPGTDVDIYVYYDMRKELKVPSMGFALLYDKIPEEDAKALRSFFKDYYANDDRKRMVKDYEKKIADKEKEIEKDFVTKREKDDGRKLIAYWQEEIDKLKAQTKEIDIDDYYKLDTSALFIRNSLSDISSIAIQS